MSLLGKRPAMRWLVPAATAVTLIGGGAAVGVFAASAEPSLPPRSAAQLLVDLQTARLSGLSGTVVQRADLGLPPLAGLSADATDNLAALVAGSNTLRVWYAGPDQARVAVLGALGETDVIRDGSDLWIWNSRTNEATHRVLSDTDADTGARPGHGSGPGGLPVTPQEAADLALAAIEPSTAVSVGRSATVAGRDAYELVLAPRDATSLVSQIRIAIDAEVHIPLRFELFARDADEASVELAFTQVDFTRPDPAQFAFNPPPGATVTEAETEAGAKAEGESARAAEPGGDQVPDGWTTVGQGWTTVIVGRIGTDLGAPGGPAKDGDKAGRGRADGLAMFLGQLPTVSGAWGSGRLLAGDLFSVLLTDDGRLLAGAVTPERLYEVAATQR